MFTRILKKDLKRKKGINVILFLFILIATVFLASSMNNMLVVSNAMEYFLDKAKIPDEVMFALNSDEGAKQLREWLSSGNAHVTSYQYQDSFNVPPSNVTLISDGERKEYKTENSVYLQTNPEEYVKVFDREGNPIKVADGQITMLISEAKLQGMKIGDQIEIRSGDITKTFTLSELVKDALFTGNMASMVRFIISDHDYEELKSGSESIQIDQYYITTDDTTAFEKACSGQDFINTPNSLPRETLKLLYAMDMIVAGILTVIGVCLILIAVLVLRFTIVFTMEEEFREIGIMKAIGIRGAAIKRLYLIKYLVLVLAGAGAGCIISFPVGNLMLQSVSSKMLMADSSNNGICNILCAIAVVIFVLALCYLSMHKLNKLSAIDAIRSGQTGERFGKKSVFKLHRSRLAVPFFIAVNDIFSNVRRYIVLLLVFAVGIILMIVPFNTINTMKSPQMAQQFGMDTTADIYMGNIEYGKHTIATTQELEEAMKRVEQELADKGYDATLSTAAIQFVSFHTEEDAEGKNLLTLQPVACDGSYLLYSEGKTPVLENEIGISSDAMKELGVTIGDTVEATLCGEEREFIITGTYQDYMQLGKSARLNTALDLSQQPIYEYWHIQVYLHNREEFAESNQELITQLRAEFPQYTFNTAQEIVNNNVGGIVDIVEQMRVWLIALMAGINVLITILMMKMFLMSEKGEIAMLRSIGFRNHTIRLWQIARIAGILLLALILAIPLSRLMDYFVLSPIFGIMGAEIDAVVIPQEVYVLYPGILLLAIILAAIYSSATVKKINVREINTIE